MNDAQRLALLTDAIGELKLTQDGYVPTKGQGGHWKDAMPKLNALARDLKPKPPTVTMCYPIARNAAGSVCQGWHRTAGDDDFAQNWAMDFCAPAMSVIVAPEAGHVFKLSGHDPATAHPNPDGVYGWSIYVETSTGWLYYFTHLGQRKPLAVGDRVKMGQALGRVGNQQPFTGRPNHLHGGATAPSGAAAPAKARIAQVSRSPRVLAT